MRRLPRQGDLFASGPPQYEAARALFEEFWPHYPRKVGKLDAMRAWLQVRPLPDHAFTVGAIDAIERQKQDPKFWEDGGRWIPHPASWLRAGRYLDEPLEVPSLSREEIDQIDVLGKWARQKKEHKD